MTIRSWVKKTRDGAVLQDNCGKPRDLDTLSITDLSNWILEKNKTPEPATAREVKDRILYEKHRSLLRRNIRLPSCDITMDHKTLKRLRELEGLIQRKRQVTTLNHSASREREAERQRLIVERSDPVAIQLKKDQTYARKLLVREEKKERAKTEQQEKKRLAQQEKEHVASLTKAEKLVYKRQKKLKEDEIKEKKRQDREAKEKILREELEHARDILGPVEVQNIIQQAAVNDVNDESEEDDELEDVIDEEENEP